MAPLIQTQLDIDESRRRRASLQGEITSDGRLPTRDTAIDDVPPAPSSVGDSELSDGKEPAAMSTSSHASEFERTAMSPSLTHHNDNDITRTTSHPKILLPRDDLVLGPPHPFTIVPAHGDPQEHPFIGDRECDPERLLQSFTQL